MVSAENAFLSVSTAGCPPFSALERLAAIPTSQIGHIPRFALLRWTIGEDDDAWMQYKSQVAECARNDFCCCGCGRVGRTYPWGFNFYPVADAHLPGNVLLAALLPEYRWLADCCPEEWRQANHFSFPAVLGYELARRHRTAVSSVEEDITVSCDAGNARASACSERCAVPCSSL